MDLQHLGRAWLATTADLDAAYATYQDACARQQAIAHELTQQLMQQENSPTVLAHLLVGDRLLRIISRPDTTETRVEEVPVILP